MKPEPRVAHFTVGEKAVIAIGAHRGLVVTVREEKRGWPFPNYRVEHPTHGSFAVNERELAKHEVTP